MALVYVADRAREHAHHYGVAAALDQFVQDCKHRDFLEAASLFAVRHPYRYRRFPSHLRLVAKVDRVDETEIICILDLLKKGDMAVEEFNNDPGAFGKRYLEGLVDRAQLLHFVENERLKDTTQVTPRDKLPDALRRWWVPFDLPEDREELIMESQDWVTRSQNRDYMAYWQSYYDLVFKIVCNEDQGAISVQDDLSIQRLSDRDGCTVYYSRCRVASTAARQDTTSVIYLVGAARDAHARHEFEDELRITYKWIGSPAFYQSLDAIACHAWRSYPSLLLVDKEAWRQVQQDQEANLALSGEESQILSQARHIPTGSREPALPMFINGRAGSGKSTILYYLFSDYLDRKTKSKETVTGELLFLTYGEALLDRARNTISRLLRYRADWLTEGRSSKRTSHPEECFYPFRDFVLSQAPEESAAKFRADRRIDYRRFRQLYLKSNIPDSLNPYVLRIRPAKGISPDLSWHVIRTFIKGYHADGYLTPEEYEDIPNKDKSVFHETYEYVYHTIWMKWYKNLYDENELWDSQDLVREALCSGWVKPQYAVVFCDEAQDFTRIEIDLILRLLAYREYDLGWEKRVRLPFALAGDPFQTLNPTGFRWEALKASFYDEITRHLDPGGRGVVDFDYQELSHNYRSTSPIVKLGNLLLLWRALFFDVPNVKPQHPWRHDHSGLPPMLFVIDQNLSSEQFREITQDAVIIVPCEEGQEQEYIATDEILNKWLQQGETFTVLSPVSAKGLEFPRVILYQFGESCPPGLLAPSDPGTADRLEKEYLINKLYVAVTRAMKDLVIVDTPQGAQRLWTKMLDPQAIDALQKQARHPEEWSEAVAGVVYAQYEDARPKDREDPGEIAERLQRGGREQGNPYLMRQAAQWFRKAGKERDTDLCQAEALEMEEHFEAAGEVFVKLGEHGSTERCYWKGMCWKRLSAWYVMHPDQGHHFRRLICRVITLPQNVPSTLDLIAHLLAHVTDGKKLPFAEPQFQTGVNVAINCVCSGIADGQLTTSDLLPLTDLLPHLRPLYKQIGLDHIAEVYFHAEHYEKAVQAWDQAGEQNIKSYYQARAEITPSPDNIRWWSQAEDYTRAIREYETAGHKVVDDQTMKAVARAYVQQGNHIGAFDTHMKLGEYQGALDSFDRFLREAGKQGTQPSKSKPVRRMFRDLVAAILAQGRRRFSLCEKAYRTVARRRPRSQRLLYARDYLDALAQGREWKRAMAYTIYQDIVVGTGTQEDATPEHTILQTESARDRIVERHTLFGLPPAELLHLQLHVIKRMAHGDLGATRTERQLISEYVRQVIDLGPEAWHAELSLPELTVTIEKTWRDVDALQLYEDLDQMKLDQAEERWIRERWLKVKSRQIARMEREARNGSQDIVRTLQHRRQEFEEKSSLWEIDPYMIGELPEYPDPDSVLQDLTSHHFDVQWVSPKCLIVCNYPDGSNKQLLIDVSRGRIDEFGGLEYNQGVARRGIVYFQVPEWRLLNGRLRRARWLRFEIGERSYEYKLE